MSKPWINKDGSIDCPNEDFECPYYKEGECTLENVEEECDDFYSIWGDEIEEPDEPFDLDCGFDPYMGCYTDDC
jgi:hypothetical protein